jgi:hypothetical protein
MRVTLLLYPPFSDLLDKEICIEFVNKSEVDFLEIITKFIELYPQVKSLLPSINEVRVIYGNMMPVRGNAVVNLKDTIFDQDIIKFYGSLSGG